MTARRFVAAALFGIAVPLVPAAVQAQSQTTQNQGVPNQDTQNQGRQKPSRPLITLAPGTPATVGRDGSLRGVRPGQSVPAPVGAMSTFGIPRPSGSAGVGANAQGARQ